MAALVEKLTKLIRDKFHGKITIHFAHGVPKKLVTEQTEDIA